MFAETRSLTHWLRLSLALAGCVMTLAIAPRGTADDRVYRYRGADGREVFTNAGRVAIDGQAPTALALPPISSAELSAASPSQLLQLDRGVQHAHDELQAGDRCKAIRASSRVPTRTFVFRQHLREVCIASVLLAVGLLVLGTWQGRLRKLMPLAPLVGCFYLGYATYARVEQRVSLLREGLRACSSDLPPADGVSPSTIKARLESTLSLQATIDRAYAQRELTAERILRER